MGGEFSDQYVRARKGGKNVTKKPFETIYETVETISRTRLRAREGDAITRGLERLAARYGWSSEELVTIRAQIELCPDLIQKYWKNLAIARAAGFVQSQENGFLTLRAWCAATGRCDPTWLALSRD